MRRVLIFGLYLLAGCAALYVLPTPAWWDDLTTRLTGLLLDLSAQHLSAELARHAPAAVQILTVAAMLGAFAGVRALLKLPGLQVWLDKFPAWARMRERWGGMRERWEGVPLAIQRLKEITTPFLPGMNVIAEPPQFVRERIGKPLARLFAFVWWRGFWFSVVIAAIATGVGYALYCYWTPLSTFLGGPLSQGDDAASAKATPLDIIYKLSLILGGGTAFILATWRGWCHSEQTATTTQGHITDRFIRASELLGSEQMSSRLGGIFMLWRTGKESKNDDDRRAVLDMLCAFIREPTPDAACDGDSGSGEVKKDGEANATVTETTNATANGDNAPSVTSAATTPQAAATVVASHSLVGATTNDAATSSSATSAAPTPTAQNSPSPAAMRTSMRNDVRAAASLLTQKSMNAFKLPEGYEFDLTDAQLPDAKLENVRFRKAQLSGCNLAGAALPGAWLSKADLANANLKGADLTKSDLAGADLTNTNLKGAKFNGADLSGTDLMAADLTKANLTGANLTKADISATNLTRTHFVNANLTSANLMDADLTKAVLTNADLTRANLTGANLTGANLTRANLTQTDLMNADFTRANLTQANLKGVDLLNAEFMGANFTQVDLAGAALSFIHFQWANLTQAKLTGADLTNADLTGSNLTQAKLTGADLSLADLTEVNLTEANLTQADLMSAEFTDANLTQAKLKGANVMNATLVKANLEQVDLTGADLSLADLSGANLSEANLSEANLTGTDLTGSILIGAFILPRSRYGFTRRFRPPLTPIPFTRAHCADADSIAGAIFTGDSSDWPRT